MGAIRHFMGILRQTSGPAVSAAAAAAAAVTAAVIAAAVTTAATVAVVVADDVAAAAAVMRVRHHLVSHVLLMRAEELLQPDNGRDHQGDLAYQEGLAGDHGDRAEREGQ